VKVESVTLHRVTLPLKAAFETSSHRKQHLTHILLRAVGEDGVAGWGEACCETAPLYGAETVETCWHVLREFLVPAMLELEWEHPSEVAAALERFRGNHFAKAGVDIAAWDLAAKADGVTLAAALGATGTEAVSGVSVGIHADPEHTAREALRIAAAGYRRVKLKVRPGMAEEVVRLVGDALAGTGVQLAVDANGVFGADDVAELERLDAYGLALIEQPFDADAWELHRDLAARLDTPICLDESIGTVGAARLALELGACDVINVKVSRLGGLTQALAVHDLCRTAGVPVWCGGMHEFGVGRAANVALSALPGFTMPGDLSGSDERYEFDVVDPPILARDGAIPVPSGAGIGYRVLEDRIAELAEETLELTAARSRPVAPVPDEG
jgi:O-succinylbenzoate synthase